MLPVVLSVIQQIGKLLRAVFEKRQKNLTKPTINHILSRTNFLFQKRNLAQTMHPIILYTMQKLGKITRDPTKKRPKNLKKQTLNPLLSEQSSSSDAAYGSLQSCKKLGRSIERF